MGPGFEAMRVREEEVEEGLGLCVCVGGGPGLIHFCVPVAPLSLCPGTLAVWL